MNEIASLALSLKVSMLLKSTGIKTTCKKIFKHDWSSVNPYLDRLIPFVGCAYSVSSVFLLAYTLSLYNQTYIPLS